MLAAAALRANEVVSISIDAPPLDNERARAVDVPFLGGRAQLLPGVVTLAQLTGAPVLMGFLYRGADYRHQVWEISAPVPLEGETATAFGRCVAEVSAAIRRSPAHWNLWHTVDLARLGLIEPQRDRSPAAGPASTRREILTTDQQVASRRHDRPPVLSSHVASAGSAMRWLNSSRALRLCDRLASSAVTGSISPSAKRR